MATSFEEYEVLKTLEMRGRGDAGARGWRGSRLSTYSSAACDPLTPHPNREQAAVFRRLQEVTRDSGWTLDNHVSPLRRY